MAKNFRIKKISTNDLIPGMYIDDLNCGWLDHPFVGNSLAVKDEATANKIRQLGIREVYIDPSKGLDLAHAPTADEVSQELDEQIVAIATAPAELPKAVSLAEEVTRARKLHSEANKIVKNLMGDIRLGKQIELDKVDPLVEGVVDSIFRNKNALMPLALLKSHDDYTFQHSVNVCALMVAFARGLDLDRATIKEIASGALLHDVGKAKVPDDILNKPAKLTDAEFIKMKNHVVQSKIILQATPGVSQIAMDVASQHHERFDGSGYPNKLVGQDISMYGQMGAIVDVYDALSSDRVYHKGMPPTLSLKKLLEWSNHHFEPKMVQIFIRAVGIYPTGSLVKLESGRLGVVTEQNESDLLHPAVKVIFSVEKNCYITPCLIDLKKSQDRILGHEDYVKWNINPHQWLPTP
jgi:putative nucleotidyltransferase with HDIG domain